MFLQIIDDLRSYLPNAGITAVVDEGIESKNEQTNYDPTAYGRVVFVAKDPGPIEAPRFIGENDDGRRALWDLTFIYEVSFAGYDASQPTRDLAHRKRCVDLFEAVTSSIQLSYAGEYRWGAARWEDTRKTMRHGAELTVQLELVVPIFDAPSVLVTPVSGVLENPIAKRPA